MIKGIFLFLTIILGIVTIYLYATNKPKGASIITTILTVMSLVITINPSILEKETVKTDVESEDYSDSENEDKNEEENTNDFVEPTSVPEYTEENIPELSDEYTDILPINTKSKTVDNIADQTLVIESIELNYLEGNISTDEQIDTYQFIPSINGRYRFEAVDMLSGVKINIVVLNQAGDRVDGSSYGIENGDGLTIDNMVANETYTIQIKQYSSYSSYKILVGTQKNTVNIENNVTQVTDSIQYTDQKNIYQFTPPLSGRYRFELSEMVSGTEVNMALYNPGGERVDGTSYGITNSDGLTIDNMNAGETYNIIITQYTSTMTYKLLIGYQKETIQINGETEIEDSIQYTSQLNQYSFIPPINGRYRFEISDITSGVNINMIILNQAGGRVDGTSYGISKYDGLTIDDMIAGETYTIQIIQYNSYSPYKLEIGYQKDIVELTGNNISDTMQYTQQLNIYKFSPQINGSYSFLIDNMISGMKINMAVYNEGGERIDGTSYGIENGNGLTIDDMVKGDIYTIYIIQYEGEGSYSLFIN